MDERESIMTGVRLSTELEPLFNDATYAAVRSGVKDETWREFTNFSLEASTEQRIEMLCEITKLVGNAQIDQDSRSFGIMVAEELFTSSAYEIEQGVFNKASVIDTFCESLATCTPDDDELGAPFSLYELNQLFVRHLGRASSFDEQLQLRGKVSGAWHNYIYRLQAAGKASPEWTLNALETSANILPFQAAENQQNAEWEWARKEPELDEEDKPVHDAVAHIISRDKSFKPFLSGASEGFREKAKQYGVELASYRNLTDPEKVQKSIDSLGRLNQKQQDLINEELAVRGITAEALATNPELARDMSDEVAQTLAHVYRTQLAKLQAPSDIFARLDHQAEIALTARRPGKVMEPIKNLLVIHGLIDADADWRAVHTYYKDPATHLQLAHILTQAYETGASELEQLRELQIDHPYTRLRMGRRDFDDMHSGDITRDCTAYHLENGFNAWTLPYWIMNPGFNLMYAVDEQGGMLAKFGTLLALDEAGQPRLVIDSIETSKYINDPSRALTQTQLALHQMQAWADRLGLGDVIMCTYTNSSELMSNLPTAYGNAAKPTEALDGLNGLRTVRKQLMPWLTGEESSEKSYLQSEFDPYAEAQVYDGDRFSFEAEQALSELENIVVEVAMAAAKRRGPEARQKVFAIARSGDAERFIRNIPKVLAPRLFKSLNTSGEQLHKFFLDTEDHDDPDSDDSFKGRFDILLIGYVGQVRAAGQGFEEYEEEFNFYESYVMSGTSEYVQGIKNIKYLRGEKGKRFLDDEVEDLHRLFTAIHRLKTERVSLTQALTYIFGGERERRAEHEEALDSYRTGNTVKLRKDLPVLDRDSLDELFGPVI